MPDAPIRPADAAPSPRDVAGLASGAYLLVMVPILIMLVGVVVALNTSTLAQPWPALIWTTSVVVAGLGVVVVAVRLAAAGRPLPRRGTALAVVGALVLAATAGPAIVAAATQPASRPAWSLDLPEAIRDVVQLGDRIYASTATGVHLIETSAGNGRVVGTIPVADGSVVTPDGAVWTVRDRESALYDRNGTVLWRHAVPDTAPANSVRLHARGRTAAGDWVSVLRWCRADGCTLTALADDGRTVWTVTTKPLSLYNGGGVTEARTSRAWHLRPERLSQVPSVPMTVRSGKGASVLDLASGAEVRTWPEATSLATSTDGSYVLTEAKVPEVSAIAPDGTVRWRTTVAACDGALELYPQWVACAGPYGVTAVLDRATGRLAVPPSDPNGRTVVPDAQQRVELAGSTAVVATSKGTTGWSLLDGRQLWQTEDVVGIHLMSDRGIGVWTTSNNPYAYNFGIGLQGRAILDPATGRPLVRVRSDQQTALPWFPVDGGALVATGATLGWYALPG